MKKKKSKRRIHHTLLRRSQSNSSNAAAALKNLPEEIITEILARLPVKSLLRFRSVSKSWLALISSSRFIKTHLAISTNNFENHRILLTVRRNHCFNLQHCSVHSLLFEPSTIAHTTVDYPHQNLPRDVRVVGSCNGLICIAVGHENVFLWNPSTRMWKKLPPAGVTAKGRYCYNKWGFGFDESCDDYKVVGMFCVFENEAWKETTVKIYSLKADSWKRIQDFEGEGIYKNDTCKFANGKIHFLAGKKMDDLEFRWDIVSLDLETELYGTIELPNFGGGRPPSYLLVLGGCISFLYDSQDTHFSDLWVMKDYGVMESWTKVVSIPFFGHWPPESLCMLPNKEILIVYCVHFAIYNPTGDCFRSLEISKIPGSIRRADIYIESLVTL